MADNRGPNWRGNGFDKDPSRASLAGKKGGKAKGLKQRFTDAMNEPDKYEEQVLDELKRLYLAAALKDAEAGDFKKVEFWEKCTGRNKHVAVPEDTAVADSKLEVEINLVVKDKDEVVLIDTSSTEDK